MKERLYVRVAKRPNFRSVNGSRFKIDAGPSHNPRPLEQGETLLKTLHFAIDVEMPDELFKDPAMPVVKLQVEPGQGYLVEPTLVQAEVPVPDEVPPE
jgi:hypothetical protein